MCCASGCVQWIHKEILHTPVKRIGDKNAPETNYVRSFSTFNVKQQTSDIQVKNTSGRLHMYAHAVTNTLLKHFLLVIQHYMSFWVRIYQLSTSSFGHFIPLKVVSLSTMLQNVQLVWRSPAPSPLHVIPQVLDPGSD